MCGFFYGRAQWGRLRDAASYGRSLNPLLPGHQDESCWLGSLEP